jgi:tetratricopeptide (TPR) repeat protein
LPNDSFAPDLYCAHGDFYVASANYSQAIDMLSTANKLYTQQKRPKGNCSALTNLGNTYYYVENYERALECYKATRKRLTSTSA